MNRASVTCAACAMAFLLAAGSAVNAQSSGNPKGSIAPSSQGASTQAPAGSRTAPDAASGKLDDSVGPSSARTNRTVPPGGGTAGGLTRRNLSAADPDAKSTTDKGSAAGRPESPSTPSAAASSPKRK